MCSIALNQLTKFDQPVKSFFPVLFDERLYGVTCVHEQKRVHFVVGSET